MQGTRRHRFPFRKTLVVCFVSACSILTFLVIAPLFGESSPQVLHEPSVVAGVPPVVFVSRNPLPGSGRDNCMIPGFGPRFRTATAGGKILVREPDGTIRPLIGEDAFFDVADPCVSWDGTRILFSGLVDKDSSWRIFEVSSDGSDLKQRTFTDRTIDLSQFGQAASLFERYDDVDPCYLPDGRVVCASTRFPSLAGYDQLPTSNLFVLEPGGGMRRITSERNGGEEPTVDPLTGLLVYARWWLNRDLPSNQARHGVTRDRSLALTDDEANIWQAITIRSDGQGMKLYAGFTKTRIGTQTYKPSVMDDGRLLSVFSPSTSLRNSTGGTGIRWFNKGVDYEHPVIGVRSDKQAVPPFATDPVQLGGDTILLSCSPTGNDFGIFICDINGTGLRLLCDLPGSYELEPQPLRARTCPPVVAEEFPYPTASLPPTEDPKTYLENDTFRFDCMNIYANGPVDVPMPNAPNITTGARIRFFMNVQRQNPSDPDPSIYLKDAEVFLDGGVHVHDIPADVPLFEQVVDGEGKVLTSRQKTFAHVTGMNFDRMGSGTKCVGCHAGHSVLPVPLNGTVAEWTNLSPSAAASASSSGTFPDGLPSEPASVIDRQARTGGEHAWWVSAEGEGARVSLSWEIPVEVREFVLYNIPTGDQEISTLAVHDCEIMLYYKNRLVGHVISTGNITPGGSTIGISPTDIDSATFIIRKFSGTYRGRSVAGLAEIETIARVSRLNYPHKQEG